jgi:hypothetical protein
VRAGSSGRVRVKVVGVKVKAGRGTGRKELDHAYSGLSAPHALLARLERDRTVHAGLSWPGRWRRVGALRRVITGSECRWCDWVRCERDPKPRIHQALSPELPMCERATVKRVPGRPDCERGVSRTG